MVPGGAVAVRHLAVRRCVLHSLAPVDEVLRELGVERPPSAGDGAVRSLRRRGPARRGRLPPRPGAAGVVDYRGRWTRRPLHLEFEEPKVVDSLIPSPAAGSNGSGAGGSISGAADLRYRDAVATAAAGGRAGLPPGRTARPASAAPCARAFRYSTGHAAALVPPVPGRAGRRRACASGRAGRPPWLSHLAAISWRVLAIGGLAVVPSSSRRYSSRWVASVSSPRSSPSPSSSAGLLPRAARLSPTRAAAASG